jgi:hypothetical protein
MFRRSELRKVKLEEISRIAGSDWATVWRKSGILPQASGRVLVGHIRIGGKDAFPIVTQLEYSTREDVVDALGRFLSLSRTECLEFLRCRLDMKSVIELVEERLVSYNGDDNQY